jgi:hypothetical protein
MNPEFPVYIISKGRWESRLTSKALEKIKVPYRIVIEPQEYEMYASVIDKEKILVLPFSNLGQGSIPARNWVWEHSLSIGAKRHWVLDDNIKAFLRYNKNLRIKVGDGTIFKCAEDFVERYENVALAGMQYNLFAVTGSQYLGSGNWKARPFLINTRIYSCILIKNDLSHRWRGRYNEDTDLSLRVLKDGMCTILFYAFLCDKAATMTMSGGNTDVLYQEDGRYKMAQSLQEQHPEFVKISQKWGRWQHVVDYSFFKRNKLIKKNVEIKNGVDNYGMVLQKAEESHVLCEECPAQNTMEICHTAPNSASAT